LLTVAHAAKHVTAVMPSFGLLANGTL
jgi:hypothetical protein